MIQRRGRSVIAGPSSMSARFLLLLQLATVALVGTESAGDAEASAVGEAFEEEPSVIELSPANFDATLRSPRHSDTAVVFFHGDDASMRDQFVAMASKLDSGSVRGYTVDCVVWPDFCRSQNARSPSVFVFMPGGTGASRVVDEPFDKSGKLREKLIVTQTASVIAHADKSVALSSDSIDSFFHPGSKPFKIILCMGQSNPPLSFQAISAHPLLTLFVDFGHVRDTDGTNNMAEELGLSMLRTPALVFIHGEDYSSHVYFEGNIESPGELRDWAMDNLGTYGTLGAVDPGFPEFDNVDLSMKREFDLLVRGEDQDSELVVTLPRASTFRQAKRAIAKRLANDEVFKGKLVGRVGDSLVNYRDQDKVGDVREVILVGADLSLYEKLDFGENGCPPGREIISAEECEKAIKSMGLMASPKWVSNFDGLPRHCSVRMKTDKGSKERMHFNSAASGTGRSDLAPVCKVAKSKSSAKRSSEASSQQGSTAFNLARKEEASAKQPETIERGVMQMTKAMQDKLLPSNGMSVMYFRSGPITTAEFSMLTALSERFRPMFKEKGIVLTWSWIDVSREPKIQALFAPPTLPSAAVLKLHTGRSSRYSMLKHQYVSDGDPETAVPQPADEPAIAALITSVLDSDARYKNLDMNMLSQAWSAASAKDARSGRAPRPSESTIVVKQPPPRGGQVRLILQRQVTVSEVKEALITRTGNHDIRENGVLTILKGDTHIVLEDTETLQLEKGKQFYLLGAHLFLYKKMKPGSPGCAPGAEIKSVAECETAITSLGMSIGPKWISAYDGVPMYCSVREKPSKDTGAERMHFNSASSGAGRKDLTPICKADGDPPPDASHALSQAEAAAAAEASASEAAVTDDTAAESKAAEPEVRASLVPQLNGRSRQELLGAAGDKVVYLREGAPSEEEEQMLVSLAGRFNKVGDSEEAPMTWMWLDLRAERRLKVVFDPPALPSAVVLRMVSGKTRFAIMEHPEYEEEALPAEEESLALFINTVLGGDAEFTPMSAAKLNSGWSDKIT